MVTEYAWRSFPDENGRQTPIHRLQGSALALVAANLVPVFGVLALGWNVGPLMVLYWAENLVVGLFNVLKMGRAQGPYDSSRFLLNGKPVEDKNRRGLIGFFILHYGFFTLGHGIFVLAIFGRGLSLSLRELGLAFVGLLISHWISFRRNFIGREEFRRLSFPGLFWQPYKRVIVMHLTILFGGVLIHSLGSPLPALLLMVGLKTGIDLASHYFEHRKA